jgi:hypothetical protein
VDLTATWTATSSRSVYGNDSPALADFGLVRHLHDGCINVVSQGHQKIREARVQSVVDGVGSPYGEGLISTSQFTTVEVHPASCG